ncbi:MAG: glycosyltransferase family 9 protein [Ignavibacteriales bacterium]|nr:glycosyltransferase family 9 protein [Ignavibacteriales bacterium]MCF8306275.1 glycosyltransferase family 9 protein [Ignavibacteriales bacterium]MCF8315996.1 glycosyltransferase family 9 protein [Ignavibacteriales bacterium]MCF8437590.1 glycosyltransferase family 9 protein [Ignavibacteriales bacterium]
MRILAIALSGIGDALMFTPALLRLREEMPEAEIHVLVMYKAAEEIFTSLNVADKVILYEFIKESPFKSLRFVLSLRSKYRATINVYPSNRLEYNAISFMIGASSRYAVRYIRRDIINLGFLNNKRVVEKDSLHNVEENVRLVDLLTNKSTKDIPSLRINSTYADTISADNYYNSLNPDPEEKIIGFHPGCSLLKNHIKRRWEPEKFAELAYRLTKEKKLKVLLFGGPEEKELRKYILEKSGSKQVVDVKTRSFNESVAIMRRCDVFVSNDSSLMHTAAALGLKTVAIIGPTNPVYIHPWKSPHTIVSLDLPCSPCFFYSPKPLSCSRTDTQFKCIRELTVDMVFEAVISFVNQNE